jgi:hypothetical protein
MRSPLFYESSISQLCTAFSERAEEKKTLSAYNKNYAGLLLQNYAAVRSFFNIWREEKT